MPPDQILDTTLRLIGNSLQNYSLQLGTFATRIGVACAFAQIVLAIVGAGQGILSRQGMGWFLGDLARRIVPVFGILWLLSHVNDWGSSFAEGYQAVAGSLAGGAILTPSSIFDHFLKMVSTIAASRSLGMWLIGILNLDDLFFGVFSLVVIIIGASIAWEYLFVALELIAYVVIGTMAVCWGTLDSARGSAWSWIQLIIATGTKIIALALLLGGIFLMADWWQGILSTAPINAQRWYYETLTMVVVGVSAFITHSIPNKVVGMIVIQGASHGGISDSAYDNASGWVGSGVRKLGL